MQVYFFAAARAAAGTAQAAVELEALPEATLQALIDHLGQHYTGTTPSGLTLAQVMEQCSFLINGQRSEANATLTDNSLRVDVLPPFAGG
ncbi:MAG: MoaD/ThiS family protein [Rothia sp. (in: high G+C Gram-positive bacteria)]|uniref:MoaD/ThiS family protein n=1 Tax=Rothia sp. (in: high G+C Gram-positive bacteria) TaxID=1885016 RepID=UPI0026E0E71C|nr:MoaD/ThiS family protein [Rothia sp. (in: high G+C Gram-positive bacteria)]MDO5749922.1 MoaD/ThiS family protein [Rothia sp. (in: high G+C Gram-positive bacteria)]